MIQEPWMLSIVEFGRPLRPGDTVGTRPLGFGDEKVNERGAVMSLVYEVRRLTSKSTPLGRCRRPLYAVVHAGVGTVLLATFMSGRQREWVLTPREIRAFKRGPRPVSSS